jgi:hypothetical protein
MSINIMSTAKLSIYCYKFINLLLFYKLKLFKYFHINRMSHGTLFDLVEKNKVPTYVKAKTLVKELASCVQVNY